MCGTGKHCAACNHIAEDPFSDTIIEVFCAWCHSKIGEKPDNGLSGISHGICPGCFDKYVIAGVEFEPV